MELLQLVGSQDQVTIAGIILDAYRALEKLAKHPNIDPEKVSITGWSLGGEFPFSAWLPKKCDYNKVCFCVPLSVLSSLFYQTRKP